MASDVGSMACIQYAHCVFLLGWLLDFVFLVVFFISAFSIKVSCAPGLGGFRRVALSNPHRISADESSKMLPTVAPPFPVVVAVRVPPPGQLNQ